MPSAPAWNRGRSAMVGIQTQYPLIVSDEQPLHGWQMHGFAADLYAFGVLLVMMLTGGEAGASHGRVSISNNQWIQFVLWCLQVYHDVREAPFEKRPVSFHMFLKHRTVLRGAIDRLPPESLKDLRDILGRANLS